MLDALADNALRLLAAAILLAAVAIFSAAETALFNLTRHQVKSLRTSPNPLRRAAGRLMERAEGTLVTILLVNMSVNVLYFAVSSLIVIRTARELPGWESTILGFLPPLGMIFFGGVLPKVLAASHPVLVSGIVAGPVYAVDRVIWPVREFLRRGVVTPAIRLLSPPERSARPIGAAELQELLEHSASRGMLAPDESVLLREIIELGTIRISEIAVPRVDMVVFDIHGSREAFLDLVRRTGHRRIPAFRESRDDLVGILRAREVILRPDEPLEDLAGPIWFVPEMKRVDTLLREFQQTGRDVAVAVDEYGGVTGLVTLDDVIERLVGDMFEPREAPADLVQRIGPDAYLVSGRLSIRDWADVLGRQTLDCGARTIGGLITTHLGRAARPGDSVRFRNLRLTVTRMDRNRIVEVRLERLTGWPRDPTEAGA